jgi:hypothetical protein
LIQFRASLALRWEMLKQNPLEAFVVLRFQKMRLHVSFAFDNPFPGRFHAGIPVMSGHLLLPAVKNRELRNSSRRRDFSHISASGLPNSDSDSAASEIHAHYSRKNVTGVGLLKCDASAVRCSQ